MELTGQVALVTGASRGIGRAIALHLAAQGANVVINYRERADAANEVAETIRKAGGQTEAIQGDVADPKACRHLVQTAVDRFGRLDILIHNAGHALEKLLLDTEQDEWDRMLAVHLTGMYALTRAALPHMITRRYGRIINMSSIWGITGASYEVAYSTAKAGQIGFTKAMAQEAGPWGITVNAVAPGWIETEMNADLTGEALDLWLQKTPVGRLGTPLEIAEVVGFLAGPKAGFITGQIISPNGGVVV
ncbi:MAG: 3-oxoacyl-(acyl-carrier protein) reductase [Symbiobacteriaceae bacterium]|nr:3-oxoacyl-(acyl-carrier protein) reductase [Symbiobacteriaceae bacterium]